VATRDGRVRGVGVGLLGEVHEPVVGDPAQLLGQALPQRLLGLGTLGLLEVALRHRKCFVFAYHRLVHL
jgi:hypothetical protein